MDETPEVITSWVEDWTMLSESWRVALVVFGLVFATATVAFIVSRIILVLEHRFERTNNLWDDTILHALRRPAIGFVWLQGVYWAAEVAHAYSEAEIFSVNDKILELGFIWILVWTLFGAVKQAEKTLSSPLRMKEPMDYTTVRAISKLLRAVVAITALLTVMQSLGYSITGVLAFGGVGGIAVGFAAKDLLANFFGGFVIHMDRPFKVGDWVRSPDRNIEGTVEEIGWRLTTIRTFDKRPLYVPNAVFTQVSVENPSRMSNRRIFETIGIRYVDVNGITGIVDDVRAMLENHEEIDAKQTLIVNFLAFNSSSLDIMVYCFTKTTQWVKYHEVKQDVLLKISDVIVSHEAEVAFPTRTLHVAESVRIDRDEAEAGKGQGSRSGSGTEEDRGDAADSGPVRDPSGAGQTTRQGDEAES